ncbi:heme exporter protein CcmD [Methylobacterium nigriterrae]|uniref:heme exporter protein CcmD n=1 Tax=Methylobacterium nigriterrae TaxID=3127512 RepID=UPI003013714A
MNLAPHLGPHGGFILGAYAFAALVMAALILNAVRDQRAQRRALAALQAGEPGERP